MKYKGINSLSYEASVTLNDRSIPYVGPLDRIR